MHWADKNYHSFDYFCKNKFGGKVAKLSLDIGASCPNRDGKLSRGGCIFCGESGSGDFAASGDHALTGDHIMQNLSMAAACISAKWPRALFLPYFQAFTNTYGDPKVLEKLYNAAAEFPNAIGVSIATRPDCLDGEILVVLKSLARKTFVIVELGLQTSNEHSAESINRCYKNSVYEQAISDLQSIGVHIVTHLILGLPNETKDDMLESVRYACDVGTDGLKLQLLHVLTDSRLYARWLDGNVPVLSLEEYCDILISCLEIIPPEVVIHRVTGDAPRRTLAAPLWSLDKKAVLNTINKELRQRNTWQGKA